MKKVTYEQLVSGKKFSNYTEEAGYIFSLIDSGRIKPVLSSSKNGKKPALYTKYWLIEEKKDYSKLINELRNAISPMINIDFYLNHPDIYEKEREYVIDLSDYLENHKEALNYQMSENERSFAIWNKEKFLSGKSYDLVSSGDVLKHCGIDKDSLSVFRTAEPLAYYSFSKDVPQNILILENLDPFYSVRKKMLGGNNDICGVSVGTLIYGGGKRVVKSFEDFEISSEPYMTDERNHLLYAGDLDYEGIGIYESLMMRMNKILNNDCDICLELYNRMIDKVEDISKLPHMKEQKITDITSFTEAFTVERKNKIIEILNCGRYIPQEIISAADY
jgi:hypothetical protein